MKLKAQNFRDGTSQRNRSLAALAPDYVSVDERSLTDHLSFTQRYAKHLRYFNAENQPEGDWESFFAGDVQRMVDYFTQPDTFTPQEADEQAKFSRPHLALLISFLKLYQYPQQQFKALTQRYLDFYYRTVLQLTEKAATPDQVHVLFGLRAGERHHRLAQGTRVSAGPDSAGAEQQYALDEDLYINQAQVASVKTLSVEKINVDLKVIHLREERRQEGFEDALKWAIGTPNQGDRLPHYPENNPEDTPYSIVELNALFQTIQDYTLEQITDEQKQYILNQLCFASIEDFKTCLDAHTREMQVQQGNRDALPVNEAEWESVYALMERAYRKKINRDRRAILRDEHHNAASLEGKTREVDDSFARMIRLALGDPNPADPLPKFPENYGSLADLYAGIVQDSPDLSAVQYVQEDLYLSVEAFKTIWETQERLAADLASPRWDEVYRLLEKAQRKKRGFIYPPIGQLEIKGITAAGIAETEAASAEAASLTRFKTFGANEPNPELPLSAPQPIGVALTSPVLLMAEGTREITVTLACDAATLNKDLITALIEEGDRLFSVSLSGEENWFSPAADELSVAVGNFVLEAPIKAYSPDELQLIYQSLDESDPFDLDADVGRYLHLKDGSLYRIAEVRSENVVRLARTEAQLPERIQIEKYNSLVVAGAYTPMGSLSFNEAEHSISANGSVRFSRADENKLLMLGDGRIYQIEQANNNAKTVSVSYWGYLPDSGNGETKKYDQIVFTSLDTLADLEPVGLALSPGLDAAFGAEDVGSHIVWDSGGIYTITGTIGSEAQVAQTGRLAFLEEHSQTYRDPGRGAGRTETIRQYASSGVYVSSLQFRFTVPDTEGAIAPPSPGTTAIDFDTPYPVVKINLRTPTPEEQAGNLGAHYAQLQNICLERASIQVSVSDVQTLQLRNDRSALSSQKPFEPFGREPNAGNSLYFYHPEIAYKRLDGLSLQINWLGLPEDFDTHYAAYTRCGLPTAPESINNNSFQAQLQLLLNRSWRSLDTQSLFTADSGRLSDTTTLDYDKADFSAINGYAQVSPDALLGDRASLLDQPRFFKLELTGQDFLHKLYPLVLNKVYRAGETETVAGTDTLLQSLTVFPAYTPEIKSLTLSYQASTEIKLVETAQTAQAVQTVQTEDAPALDRLFQLHPFGYLDMLATQATETLPADASHSGRCLLSQYTYAGELFIGIRDLHPPETVTLLMQMVAGSADMDLATPAVEWCYLERDCWQPFPPTGILADGTNGLVDTGILRFQLPTTATDNNNIMPKGLHWLRASVIDNSSAFPDTLDIRTQAVKATFVDNNNAADHYLRPLAAQSIQALVKRETAIETITQPYSSFGGRMAEQAQPFYTRVSERLRHKQRALTAWDYERIVLEQFPQIYKVKCLSQSEQDNAPEAAQVTLVVIPDIANTAPFYPLEPKAPLYLLKEIEAYVQARTSSFVKVVVKNPHYEEITYRIGVRFREGYEQGYYLNQLNQELVQFLSPWAYEAQADISFGSSIHSSAVIHFLEQRPYVDYVTNLKLIEQSFVDERAAEGTARFRVNATNLAEVRRPDSILVSAPKHLIDVITTDDYDAEEFEGIDYMVIDLDFVLT